MIEMTVLRVSSQENTYYAEIELADGVYCEPVRIPGGDITSVSYDLETGGTAVIETTISESIDSAIWRAAGEGEEISPAVNAVRAKTTGDTGTLILRCQ